MKPVIQYRSKLDDSFTVYIVFDSFKKYNELKSGVFKNDLAYTTDQKIVIIDGEAITEYTPDHVQFIIAHEIAHHYLEHELKQDVKENEIEADVLAYCILLKNGETQAADLVKQYFNTRHEIDFPLELEKKMKKKFGFQY